MVLIGEVCSSVLQSQKPSKLQDPSSFFIPYAIGDQQIEGALCHLEVSVSFMPLSLYKKLELLDLTPTPTILQLADHSIRQHVGILEDVPI